MVRVTVSIYCEFCGVLCYGIWPILHELQCIVKEIKCLEWNCHHELLRNKSLFPNCYVHWFNHGGFKLVGRNGEVFLALESFT